MSDSPPPAVTTSMAVAPASSAFSTSSLTTLAGRSITSPAAMRLMVSGLSWRIAKGFLPFGRSYAFGSAATRSRVMVLASSTAG